VRRRPFAAVEAQQAVSSRAGSPRMAAGDLTAATRSPKPRSQIPGNLQGGTRGAWAHVARRHGRHTHGQALARNRSTRCDIERPFDEWKAMMTAQIDLREFRATEREACAEIADQCAREMLTIANSHPEGSESRDRCFARAREAERIAILIRARAE
jgi:hypothetical protein